MAIKFSQFNLRTDHTSGMYLVGYDGNQNIHITVDNLFDDFINGTENTIAMFGTNGTVLADSILSQDSGATLLTVAGQLNVDAAATFDTSLTVTGDSTLNGNVTLGDASTDLITQTGTLYLNGPVKDTTDTLGAVDQVLLSDATGELTFTDLADLHVGGAEVVEVPVKNVQGSTLEKGDPVYISGSVGASGRLEVQLADASNILKMPAVGLLKQDLADNEEGFAVVTGKLRNLITDPIDGVTPTENDVIYVKPSGVSGAALTTTKPVYGNFIQNIGKVGRVSTSNDGNFVVSSILRTNDIPNLTPGRLWIGSTGNTIESQTLFVDEASSEVGIGTTDPYAELHIKNTVDNPGLMIESEQATGGNFQNSYINLRAAQTSNNTLANATIALHGVNSVNSAGAKTLVIRNQTLGGADVLISTLDSSSSATNPARFKSSGQVQFEEYGSGSFTGTIAKNLSIDSSGNIIETDPAVDGSGTLNYVPKWTPDGNTLGDSIIYDNGTQVAIGTIYPAGSVKLHVEGHFRVNDGNINITRSSLPTLYLSTSSTSTDDYALQNSGGHFQIKNVAGLGDIQFQVRNGGQIKFDNYGQNTFTGTAAKNLSVDASGNVIETDAYNWDISDGTNSETIVSGDTVTFSGGTYITTSYVAGTNTLQIDHDTTSRGNSNATRTPGYGGTFTAVDNIVTNATGHVTGVNLLTVTLPSEENYTWTLTADSGTDQTINKNDTVDIAGGTNITTSVGVTDTVTIDLDDSVTLAGELTVNGTGQSSFAGQVTIPQTPSAGTDAASKHYVDQAVTGALSYQGGYNAATNTPDLDSSPSSSIKKGWTYTVTADGLFFTEQVRVGDVIIAEVDAPTTLANWTTVQNNIDLADASTVGIGNVAGGTGIGVSYSSGTATVSQDAVTLNQNASSATPGSGGSFTAIDSITTDSTGHLTDYNLKTVTLPTATVSGSGTANYISKWNTTSALTDSLIYDTGTQLGIATTSPDSGVILQIGDGTVSERVRIYDSSNKYIDLFGSGIHFTRNNSYLRPAGAAASQTLYIGDNLGGSNPNRSWGAIRSEFNDFWFTDNGVKVMRIHNENVGIGTGAVYPNSASEKLHVDGNFRLTGIFKDGSNGAGTSGQVLSSTGASTSWISLPATYTDADVDAHLNTSTATTNQVLSWTGTDYDWVTSSASNDYVSAASFNTSDGVLTLTRTDSGTVTVDLDGRFLTGNQTITLSGDVTGSGTTSISTSISSNAVGANELNVSGNGTPGQVLISDGDGTFSWSTPTTGDITGVTAGNALTGGGTSGNVTINLSTEGPGAGTYGSTADGTKIDQITIDAYGRIQGITTGSTGTGSMSSWTIKEGNGTESTTVTNGETLTIAQGSGIQSEMTSTSSGGTITITNTDRGSSQNIFKNFAVSGQSTVAADSNNDTLTLVAGSNVSITTNATTDSITINATDTNTNNYVSSASFNTGNGVLTLNRSGLGAVTVDLDGRYLTSYTESDTLATVTARGATTTTSCTFNAITMNTPIVGSSNRIKFANNDYIRFDDANGVGRFHFDCDGSTNNASVQAATFVGALSGNASTATNASLLDNLDSTRFPYALNGSLGTTNTNTADGGIGANNIARSMFYRDNNSQFGAIGFHASHATSSNYAWQMATTSYSDASAIQARVKNNGTWSSPVTIWNSGNDGSGTGLDADLLDGFQTSSGGNRWGVVPTIASSGVLEAGKYIDFHESDTSTGDYNHRITSSGGTLSFSNSISVGGRTTTAGLTTTSDIRGNGQQLVLNAGESASYASGQTGELVYLNAEGGLQVNSSPNNWSGGWSGRKTATINDSNGNSYLPGNLTVHNTSGSDGVLSIRDGSTSNYIGSKLEFQRNNGSVGAYIQYLTNPGASEMRIYTESSSTQSVRFKTQDSYFNNRVHASQFVGQTYVVTGSVDHTYQNGYAYWYYNWHDSTSFGSTRYAGSSIVAPFDGYISKFYHRGVGIASSNATQLNLMFWISSTTNGQSGSTTLSGSGSNKVFKFTNTNSNNYDFNEGDRIEVTWNINSLFHESCYSMELVRKTT